MHGRGNTRVAVRVMRTLERLTENHFRGLLIVLSSARLCEKMEEDGDDWDLINEVSDMIIAHLLV